MKTLYEKIEYILRGIDAEEIFGESVREGWWETSTGAEFGKGILQEIKEAIEEHEKEAKS